MNRFTRKRIGIAPITVLFFVGTLLLDQTGLCVATAVAAFWHELGHFTAAFLLRTPVSSIRFDLLGARIEVGDQFLSYSDEWLLAAMGPIFSLIGSLLGASLWRVHSFFWYFSVASLLLGLLNLLPIKTFDGGRMTEALFNRFLGVRRSFFVMQGMTITVLFLMWTASIYLLLRAGGGMSLFCFSMCLLARFLESGKIG